MVGTINQSESCAEVHGGVRRGAWRGAEVHGGVRGGFFKEVVGKKIRILC